MKVACDREQLHAALQTVAVVAPARSPKAVLQNVKFEVSETGAALSATDLEISVRHAVEGVDVQTPGVVLLPVTRFNSILRESTDETIRLEGDGQGVTIRGERSQFQLPSGNPSEFPEVASFDGGDFFEAPARLLRELVRRTAFATDNESSRYALGGVKLEFDDGELLAVGTDGRRLAKMSGPANQQGAPADLSQNTIVPTRAMSLIERAVAPSDAEVKLAVRNNEFIVQTPRAMISARLLEGRFPEWRKVFPEHQDAQQIELAIGPTLAAIRQAAIVTSDESKGIDFTFGDGMLVLSGRTAEIGQSRIELPIGYDGEQISIMLNPHYAMEYLKVLDPDKTFTLQIKDGDSAAVCLTDDGYAYVIMPLARDR